MHSDPRMCSVLEAFRIRERSRCLNTIEHRLLEFCARYKKESSFITNKHMTAHMYAMDAGHHGVTSKVALKFWSPHYIRAGACFLLSERSHYSTFIKIHLRWKSGSFVLYPRDTACMASQYSATISQSRSLGDRASFFSMISSYGCLDVKPSLAAQKFSTLYYGRVDRQDRWEVVNLA